MGNSLQKSRGITETQQKIGKQRWVMQYFALSNFVSFWRSTKGVWQVATSAGNERPHDSVQLERPTWQCALWQWSILFHYIWYGCVNIWSQFTWAVTWKHFDETIQTMQNKIKRCWQRNQTSDAHCRVCVFSKMGFSDKFEARSFANSVSCSVFLIKF